MDYAEVKDYADSIGAVLKYTSAKDGKGVVELFSAVADKLISQQSVEREIKMAKLSVSNVKKQKKKGTCC